MPFNPPFVTPPIDVVFTRENMAFTPQHQELVFVDPNDKGIRQRFTIYTGEILVELSADDHAKDQTFQYPILGTFNPPSGGFIIGIKPIPVTVGPPLTTQLRSAIAYASLTRSELGSSPVWANVGSVSADLMKVELDSFVPVSVVVLSGMLTSRNSRLTSISYRVSVLEEADRSQNLPVTPPIFIGDGGWTGKYNLSGSGDVGPLQRVGIPQNTIDI